MECYLASWFSMFSVQLWPEPDHLWMTGRNEKVQVEMWHDSIFLAVKKSSFILDWINTQTNIFFSSPISKIPQILILLSVYNSLEWATLQSNLPSPSGSGEAFVTSHCAWAQGITRCVGVMRKKGSKQDRESSIWQEIKSNAWSRNLIFLWVNVFM